MIFGKSAWRDYDCGIEKEWLVTNGLGGYASATIIGANTRKYHGLLVAALNPPVQRTLFLAKLDERVEIGEKVYNLATNQTVDGITEAGFTFLQQVDLTLFPVFDYSLADILLSRQVFMLHEKNTTVILYRIYNGACPALLRLIPLINCRNFHWVLRRGRINFCRQSTLRGVALANDLSVLRLACSDGDYEPKEDWFMEMLYRREKERNLEAVEDHYIPGHFVIPLAPGEMKTVTFVATLEDDYSLDGEALLAQETARKQGIIARSGLDDDFSRRLAAAGDAFIVRRKSAGTKSVIAGYHWFDDWGRDAMISLPGLTLVTGRYEDAKEILLTFAAYCRRGLLPNAFTGAGDDRDYNTIDASLWLFQAVYKYLQYTADYEFVRREIYPVLKGIVSFYLQGTDFNIKVDEDGLVRGGEAGVHLTWMDAKIGDFVVTPRRGKPVEVNALWYNALCILRELSSRFSDGFPYAGLTEKVKDSFLKKFWYKEGGYLCDVVGDGESDLSLRPNQLFAASLPYSMLNAKQGRRIVNLVRRELYAACGLRSLAPGHSGYRGVYFTADHLERSLAYHQGTAWSWLIGPFITALRRVENYSPESKALASRLILPLRAHLNERGIGFVSEIFNGDVPHIPYGCIAQAWGVAEVLRAYVEDVLELKP